jgi:hypothetical protein
LDLVRVYTKKANQNPDIGDPIVLNNDRDGCSIESVCEQIPRIFQNNLNMSKSGILSYLFREKLHVQTSKSRLAWRIFNG